MDIGFIGLGSMGTRIVTLMLDAGHHLTLWARRPASLEPFAGRSDTARSPAEVGASAQLVGVCVWDEDDVNEVLLGAEGVFAGMRPGGIVAVHSTIPPEACRRLRVAAIARGLELVDAPVSVGAGRPKLLVMVGGEPAVIELCQMPFQSFGDPVLHLGPVGSGQIAKLVNNTLLAATVGLADDALALGTALGLRTDQLFAALSAGSSSGTWVALLASRSGAGAALLGRTHEWAHKDVGLTAALAAEGHLDLEGDILRVAARGVEVLG
jgi:3-hydroxyisobutyrate dehydrogenase-like beta-hydroxyacid dehydrogenase